MVPAAVVAEVAGKPVKVEAVEVVLLEVAVVVVRQDLSILIASKAATCTITRTLPASTGWCL